MSTEKYRNNSQQRLIRVMLALAGHEVAGLAPGEIARALDVSADAITRDLANLRLGGIAEQLTETKRWRLTPRIPQIGVAMLNGIDRAQARVNEVKQRYTTQPY